VRNCPDGSVEAHVEGEEEAVGKLIDHMRSGPPGASVSHLAADDTPPAHGKAFEVRH
jgi:acylphosphatase